MSLGKLRCFEPEVNTPEDQVKSRLLLDVIVAQSPAILELLAGEDKTLLVRGNAVYNPVINK